MMAPAAVHLGVELHLLASSKTASAAQAIPQTRMGDYRSTADVLAFAEGLDVITFDHEHVPAEVLAAVANSGTAMHPTPQALQYAQDKLAMRRAIDELGLPNPRWMRITTPEELIGFGNDSGWPVVLKTPRGGYDGKGVLVVDDAAAVHRPEVTEWFARAQAAGTGLLAEEKVPYTRELSAQIARRPNGDVAAYPVVESTQTNGVCDEVIAPAPHTSEAHVAEAERIARTVAEQLGVTGMLAVELFEVAEGSPGSGVFVNELAMRPHNSGHWTMDGSVTSQFEQHLRAVLDLPLGSTSVVGGVGGFAVMKNVLGGANQDLHAAVPEAMEYSAAAKIHLYGKEPKPGRKVGHVNVLSQAVRPAQAADEARQRLTEARDTAAQVAHIIVEGHRG